MSADIYTPNAGDIANIIANIWIWIFALFVFAVAFAILVAILQATFKEFWYLVLIVGGIGTIIWLAVKFSWGPIILKIAIWILALLICLIFLAFLVWLAVELGKKSWYLMLIGVMGAIIWLTVRFPWAFFNVGALIGFVLGPIIWPILSMVDPESGRISLTHAWFWEDKHTYFGPATEDDVQRETDPHGCFLAAIKMVLFIAFTVASYVALFLWQSRWEVLAGLTLGYIFWLIVYAIKRISSS